MTGQIIGLIHIMETRVLVDPGVVQVALLLLLSAVTQEQKKQKQENELIYT